MVGNIIHESQVKGLKYFLNRRGLARTSMISLANSALNRVELKLGRSRLLSNPDSMQIEPTTSCNLTCGMCGLQTAWSDLKKNASFMTRETFSKTIPFLKTTRIVILQGWGESLLHPDFLWMVETSKRQGCMVGVLTNGVLITDVVAEALVELDIDLVGISVDAATEESYKSIRGGDLGQVLAGLERLSAKKKEKNRRFPVLQLSYCVMKQNLHEISTLVDLAARYGVDEIVLSNLIVYRPDLAAQSVFDMPEEVAAVHAQAKAHAERLGILLFYDGVERQDRAPDCPFRTFSVLSDGSVGPCGAQRVVMGNIYDAPLRELWNSPDYQMMRRQYVGGDLPYQCKRCPNFSNAEEDHVEPDMSYVDETLARRRWTQTARRFECGTAASSAEPGSAGLLGIGDTRE